MPDTRESSLEVSEIQAGYGRKQVLNDVSFSAASGECVLLAGHNGAGKSTLLKTIAGRLSPTKGTVNLGGEYLTGLAPWKLYRRGVALVPQERDVFGELTVDENLELSARLLSEREAKTRRAVIEKAFPVLKERRSQKAAQLSGGERRMLAVAIAINPPALRLLLLDEPSAGLSPAMTTSLISGILGLREVGSFTIVVAEQKLPAVLGIADHIIVLRLGNVAQIITPDSPLSPTEIFDYF